jgi:nitroimidazol reductase NimA-like FMN-containing flavoprotein (pyridoxamine 5'-phosphate oxidase superfamily)
MDSGAPFSEHVRVRRKAERGRYDATTIHAILDEARHCHVGIAVEAQPIVIPTIHARIDDTLYLHGSPASRLLRTGGHGTPLCVTVTLVDGLVLARSAFHHSLNYRSVVVLARARKVDDVDEKRRAMTALVEHVLAGRSLEARPPSDDELRKTLVLALPIDEASAKVRTGPPIDDDDDLELPIWAGVIPLRTVYDPPVVDPLLPTHIPLPPSVVACQPEH